jgi:hypothetical protein
METETETERKRERSMAGVERNIPEGEAKRVETLLAMFMSIMKEKAETSTAESIPALLLGESTL